jgi:hypothetical protein
MLAYHSGFKNIIIHGLDFSGQYIYHNKDLQNQIGMNPPFPYTDNIKHSTIIGHELIWQELIANFYMKGVKIFCASSKSNFKKYASLWLS